MASFLPATTDRIHDLASELVLSLELSRGEGCDIPATSIAADRFAHAVRGALVAAETAEAEGASERIDETCRLLETAYSQWKSVDVAFAQGGIAPVEGGTKVRAIASVFLEPLWLFARKPVEPESIRSLKGLRIAVGAAGSGTREMIEELLRDQPE